MILEKKKKLGKIFINRKHGTLFFHRTVNFKIKVSSTVVSILKIAELYGPTFTEWLIF